MRKMRWIILAGVMSAVAVLAVRPVLAGRWGRGQIVQSFMQGGPAFDRALRLVDEGLDLNLTDTQKKSAKPIVLDAARQLRALHAREGSAQTKRGDARKILATAWVKLCSHVLTTEQAAKIDAVRSRIRDLNVTPEQRSRLRTIRRDAIQSARQVQADSSLAPDQRPLKLLEVLIQARAQASEVLTAEQKAKIAKLRDGHLAANVLAKELSLDDTQKAQAQKNLAVAGQKARGILDQAGLSTKDRARQLKTLAMETRSTIGGILTPEQRQAWKNRR